METAFLNILLAFIEGFALIISPCILPVLPIVLSGSLSGGRSRPFGIIIGFVLSFSAVTFLARFIVQLFDISPDYLRITSLILLFVLGMIMLSTWLTDKFAIMTQRLANAGNQLASTHQGEGLGGGIIFGALIGIIWTPCAGPILATVIVQIATQHAEFISILMVVAFAMGAGLPMLLIALLGRAVIDRFDLFKHHASLFRKLLGMLIMISVIYLWINPEIAIKEISSETPIHATELIKPISSPYNAPAIDGITSWINTAPLTLTALKGKVVLIDFWTYSCINCIRTLPYLKHWYAKYHDKGFEIIGVHSPEFEFEKKLENVEMAVKKFDIHYPVALDNHFKTWMNFNNRYWPAHYLIDKDGKVVYIHFGEGEYDVTENNIQFLLGVTGEKVTKPVEPSVSSSLTPETYLGYSRAQGFSSLEPVTHNQFATYHYPSELFQNSWALEGAWTIYAEKIVSGAAGAALKLHFNAKDVYLVMGSQTSPVSASIKLDNVDVNDLGGSDVVHNQIKVIHNELYHLIHLKNANEGTLEVIASAPGLELYAFTFGG